MKKKGMMKRKSQVTERDVEIVCWLGRHRLATAEQVMRIFGMQRSKVYQRLASLVDNELVRYEHGVRSARVYLATKAGLALTGLNLPGGTVSAASCAHDLAVVDVAIPIEQSPGVQVLTERELRRLGLSDGYRYSLRTFGLGSADRIHWPDLVVIDPDRELTTAIEVELTLKKADRIEYKLRAYAASRYDKVRYITGNAGIANAVGREARKVGLADRLTTEPLWRAKRKPQNSVDALVNELRSQLQQERQATELERQRADTAVSASERDSRAASLMLAEISTYLNSDRSQQKRIRSRWEMQLTPVGRT